MELSSLHTILKQEGTSQVERLLPAFDASYVKITEHSVLDHLRFAEEYSQFLVYLRADGKNEKLEKQTWKNFFSHDSTTLVASIASHDINKIKLHYASLYNSFTKTPLVFNFIKLITYTGIWVTQLDNWLKASAPSSLLYKDLSLTIAAELSPKLVKLKEYYLSTKIFGPQQQTFEEQFNLSALQAVWGNLHKITSPDQTIFIGNSEEEKLINAAIYIKAIFEAFLKTVGNTVQSAPRYLDDSLENDARHAPHMALFLSFLQIFEYGQQQMNTLTKRHLEFYYQRFLQIPVRGPVADQATILFNLTKGMPPFSLPVNSALIAGKDADNRQQTYLTDRELLVTNAKVEAIKTIYIDHSANVIKGVYGAAIANSADGKGAAFKTDNTSWDLFGKASAKLAADTGFALASPQLYFKEGTRTITLEFTLNLPLGTPSIEGELDLKLFSFYLTSTKGWITTIPATNATTGEVSIKSLSLSFPDATNSMEGNVGANGGGGSGSEAGIGSIPARGVSALMTIILNIPTATAKAVIGYSEVIHGDHYHTVYPILKAIINYPPLNDLSSSIPLASTATTLKPPTATGTSIGEFWTINEQRNLLQQATISALKISARTGNLILNNQPDAPIPGAAINTNTNTSTPTQPLDSGIGGLSLLQAASDEGELDTTKPFLPFTATPRIGSSFYLNAPEFSNKPISNAAIYLEWLLPDNFASYYQPYGILYSDNNFQVSIDLLSAQVFKNEGVYSLFDTADSTHLISLNDLDSSTFGTILNAGDQTAQAAIGIRQKEGTLRMSLLKDFGASIYPQLIVGSLMQKSGNLTLTPEDTANLKSEIEAYPLVFTQDAKIKTQLKTLANTPNIPDQQIYSAVSQGIKLHLVKQNLTIQPAQANSAALPLSAASGNKSAVSNLIDKLSNLIMLGNFSASAGSGNSSSTTPAPAYGDASTSPAGTGAAPANAGSASASAGSANASSGAASASAGSAPPAGSIPAAPTVQVNPTVDYVMRKETENHLELVSKLAATGIMNLRAQGPVTEQQIDDLVNQTLSQQQPAYLQALTSSAQNLIKVLSIPPPPYTPQLKSVQLAYDSSRDFSAEYDTFYHVLPFGISTQKSLDNLFPQFKGPLSSSLFEGQLLIGLAGVEAPQQLALFFQILDGSNTEFGPPPTVTWSYLQKDNWKIFPNDELMADSTYSLQNKGIIIFDLPSDMDLGTEQNQELNLLWLRASITGTAINLPRIAAISPNAVTATFTDQDNSPEHYTQPLPAGTISKMLSKPAQISTLSQPVATTGARQTELAQQYFTRVSERLRHKQRAVTNWDYEHLLLQEFPSVYKVKCLNNFFVNRAIADDKGKFIPGHLSLVLIPDLRNQTAAETIPLKPRVTYKQLIDAEKYLSDYSAPQVQVHAVNAAFDVVKVKCTVKFRTGLDNGSQVKKLNADLIAYLAPWTVNTSVDISFQVKIYASSLLDFIDKRSYVDYVTGFDMYCNDSVLPLVETVASTPFSIMVSAPKHDISYIET